MPIEVREKFESRRLVKSVTGSNSSAELVYIVLGTDNDIAARDALEAEAPATYATLPRQSVQLEPLGPGLWDGVVRYALSSGGGGLPTGESSFQFDTGGGTQHITQSLATVQRVPAPGMVAPDFQGAIGVSADGVEGIDITVPVYHFAETHYKPDAQITGAYKGVLFNLTGKVNGDSFRGFAPGEVLFLGASGSKRGSGWMATRLTAPGRRTSTRTMFSTIQMSDLTGRPVSRSLPGASPGRESRARVPGASPGRESRARVPGASPGNVDSSGAVT